MVFVLFVFVGGSCRVCVICICRDSCCFCVICICICRGSCCFCVIFICMGSCRFCVFVFVGRSCRFCIVCICSGLVSFLCYLY